MFKNTRLGQCFCIPRCEYTCMKLNISIYIIATQRTDKNVVAKLKRKKSL